MTSKGGKKTAFLADAKALTPPPELLADILYFLQV